MNPNTATVIRELGRLAFELAVDAAEGLLSETDLADLERVNDILRKVPRSRAMLNAAERRVRGQIGQ